MKKAWWPIVAILIFALSTAAKALPYSDLYVFGDSLSDQGNVHLITGGAVPPPEYTDGTTYGRFTNGKNYVDYLSQSLGLTVTPSLLGGTNYAYGGARTDSHILPSPPALSLLQQRDAYIANLGGGNADGGALYIVWAGANNLSDIFTKLATVPGYTPNADLFKAASDIADVVASLAASGAHSIVVPNIPDLGLAPGVTGGGPPNPNVSLLTAQFNLLLANMLGNVDLLFPTIDLIQVDTFSMLRDIYSDPAAYGFTNATDACYSNYVAPGGTTCANPEDYVFWDLAHPTTATHRIMAAYFLQAVPEPETIALLGLGLLALVLGRTRQAKHQA